MGQEEMNSLKDLLPLAERYGLAVVLSFILLLVVVVIIRMIIRGDLVPRSLLDKAEEDRDRLQAILDKEREGFMTPLLEVVKNLKQQDGSDHKGG
ncbi:MULTISPECIES: hypothetical protein [Paenibacillus]|uniref:hypothetical protein n=1 Tax=Paenibacillus TaxID=44249 RepID=UPI0008382992|nr:MULTISPECIES: hypothetical protein [Paenibacillus]GIP20418.1 hypothetical protein J22TS3_06930 [Paenibacillus sp. J22TS3]